MAYTCSNAAGVCSVSFNYIVLLSERVLCRIADACRLVISNLIHIYADIFKYLIQRLSIMSEGDRSMMRIISLNQYMTVKSLHFRDGKDADCSKGAGSNWKNLSICNISAQPAVSSALQTEECDIAGRNVPL